MFVQACLDVLLPVEDSSLEDSMKRFPRAERALNSGPVDHALFEYVSLRIKVEMEIYWTRKYYLIFCWIWVRDNMDEYYSWQIDRHDRNNLKPHL